MGCDWYSIYQIVGIGIIIQYDGTVTGFLYTLINNKLDIFDNDMCLIGENDDTISIFIGNIIYKQALFDCPGSYEIDDYPYSVISENSENYTTIDKSKTNNLENMVSGFFKITNIRNIYRITTCRGYRKIDLKKIFYYDNCFSKKENDKINLKIDELKQIFETFENQMSANKK